MSDNTDKVISFLKKHGIFYGAQYFGGMDSLVKLSKKYPKLNSYIDNATLGRIKFKAENNRKYKFDIRITGVDINEEIFDEVKFVTLNFDLILNNELNEDEKMLVGEWIQSYLNDFNVDFEFNDPNFLSDSYRAHGIINSINGVEEEFLNAENIDDFEVEHLLLNNQLNKSLKEIQILVNKIL